MNLEYSSSEEPRDRTKLIWAVVLAVVVLMVLVMWGMGQARPVTSEVRARHILVQPDTAGAEGVSEAYELAQELRERLVDGESFSRLARQYSADPRSAARGGDLGYADRGTYEDAFEQYLWQGSVGEISPVIQTSHGYHIIEILDRRWSEADRYHQEIRRRSLEELEAPEPEAP